MLEINKIYYGDSKEVLNNIDDAVIDLVVIDPPYKIVSTKSAGHNEIAESIKKYKGIYSSYLKL